MTLTQKRVDDKTLVLLIEKLKSKDGMVRQKARIQLIAIGEPALELLMKAFEDKGEYMQFEAAKALSRIGTRKAVKTLVEALDDERFRVRWIAAEGLIDIGCDALRPLLEALISNSGSFLLRESAHHVLWDLLNIELVDDEAHGILLPVLQALSDLDAVTVAPVTAYEALKQLRD